MTTQSFTDREIEFPEIFIGIASPVGTDVSTTIKDLTEFFEEKEYSVHHIKISEILKDIAELLGYGELKESPKNERINSYIDFGNYLRGSLGNDYLSAISIANIISKRIQSEIKSGYERNVYIINQLKTEEELKLLRETYSSLFFQISIYSARDVRVDNLSKAISHDLKKADRTPYRSIAEKLVERDEDEADIDSGQKVGKIFQQADIVLNADQVGDHAGIKSQVKRFVNLLFGSNSYSPNRVEYGMFVAFSAALRSLDLSRQVGAAIFRNTGEIISLGSNEVPKAGGGTYWADDLHDAREYRLKIDSNDERKSELLNEILEILYGENSVISPQKREELESSQMMDALEYGRIVHAEMCAISDAARLGIPLAGSTLYCTTFPCHMCSKHIVAAGIAKVYFLEPYPKSLTSHLHSDSVKIEGSPRGRYEQYPAVEYIPFLGITPRRYRELFSRKKRKNNGEFLEYQRTPPQPVISLSAPWYLERENKIAETSLNKLRNFAKSPSKPK